MEFTVETADLASALNVASVAMTGKTTLPILGMVRIEVESNQCTLSGTNLDIFVSRKILAKVKKPGAITASFDILNRLTARMDSKTVSMKLKDKDLTFKSGDVTATIETLPAEEFPQAFKQDRSTAIECDAEEIIKPFSKLAHAMCDDARRYSMQGINFSPSDNGTTLVATNAARMLTYKGVALTQSDVIAPQVFVRAILSIKPSGTIKFIIADGVITVISDDTEISSKLIEASYPNWKGAVPKRSDQAFSCGRKQLISALQTCAIFAEYKLPALYLKGKGKEIEVSQPNKATAMVLGTELAGQPDISIHLNSKWLVETLGVFEGENIRIQVGEQTPIMIEEGPLTAIINRIRE